MRTTIDLDDDVLAAIRRLRTERGLGLSEALNELARAGLSRRPRPTHFRQRSTKLGLKLDVSNVAEALETIGGPARR